MTSVGENGMRILLERLYLIVSLRRMICKYSIGISHNIFPLDLPERHPSTYTSFRLERRSCRDAVAVVVVVVVERVSRERIVRDGVVDTSGLKFLLALSKYHRIL